jgi:hypothetical protein
MKTQMLIFLTLLLMLAGCSSQNPSGTMPTNEYSALQKIMADNVIVGMSKEELMNFFHRRGWDASYGDSDDAYYLRFSYPSKSWDHIVTITVWLKDSKWVKDYKITDNYVAP